VSKESPALTQRVPRGFSKRKSTRQTSGNFCGGKKKEENGEQQADQTGNHALNERPDQTTTRTLADKGNAGRGFARQGG